MRRLTNFRWHRQSPRPRPIPRDRAASSWALPTFQSSYGVAQLVGPAPRPKPSRTNENADVARVNDSNGLIRYGGKTEQMN